MQAIERKLIMKIFSFFSFRWGKKTPTELTFFFLWFQVNAGSHGPKSF